MRTRCPNPKCKLAFEVPDAREGKNGPCPQCGQVITFRSVAVLNEIERQHQRMQQRASHSPHRGDGPGERGVPFSALLEDVRSLWNVGSIFRTADGAGVGKLYLCGITGCPPRKEIAKTSLGAEEVIPWEYGENALDVLPGLRASGVQIVALEKTETSEPLRTAVERGALKPPLCLVVGNEVAGVSAEALSQADRVCHLPMRGVKGSLNVAVAFGVAAYLIDI
jgi:23S rRNA (guanosine2251-2'-O)-methyltransferase